MPREGDHRFEATDQLVLALGTGVEALQAIAYRMFDPLLEAGREIQAVLDGALTASSE